jgi:hypothetical protein
MQQSIQQEQKDIELQIKTLKNLISSPVLNEKEMVEANSLLENAELLQKGQTGLQERFKTISESNDFSKDAKIEKHLKDHQTYTQRWTQDRDKLYQALDKRLDAEQKAGSFTIKRSVAESKPDFSLHKNVPSTANVSESLSEGSKTLTEGDFASLDSTAETTDTLLPERFENQTQYQKMADETLRDYRIKQAKKGAPSPKTLEKRLQKLDAQGLKGIENAKALNKKLGEIQERTKQLIAEKGDTYDKLAYATQYQQVLREQLYKQQEINISRYELMDHMKKMQTLHPKTPEYWKGNNQYQILHDKVNKMESEMFVLDCEGIEYLSQLNKLEKSKS